jgi:opacity protein-like surface antigen
VSPYLAAGAGAVTFLSNSDSNRYPQLDRSETAFAVNFGGGVTYGVTDRWAVRADVRELVAFPSNDAVGFSQNGNADPVWMERGTVGLVYRF